MTAHERCAERQKEGERKRNSERRYEERRRGRARESPERAGERQQRAGERRGWSGSHRIVSLLPSAKPSPNVRRTPPPSSLSISRSSPCSLLDPPSASAASSSSRPRLREPQDLVRSSVERAEALCALRLGIEKSTPSSESFLRRAVEEEVMKARMEAAPSSLQALNSTWKFKPW
eukprot:3940895-Rhodomonas_salina.1